MCRSAMNKSPSPSAESPNVTSTSQFNGLSYCDGCRTPRNSRNCFNQTAVLKRGTMILFIQEYPDFRINKKVIKSHINLQRVREYVTLIIRDGYFPYKLESWSAFKKNQWISELSKSAFYNRLINQTQNHFTKINNSE